MVVKVLHPDVLHKTDAGGVHLGIADEESLERALDAIDRIAGARYLVEETAPPGRELILGARRDPVFGPLVALGSGGTASRPPTTRGAAGAARAAEAAAMLDELAARRLPRRPRSAGRRRGRARRPRSSPSAALIAAATTSPRSR